MCRAASERPRYTSGIVVVRRPPKRIGVNRHPLRAFPNRARSTGTATAGAVKRLLGWAAGVFDAGVQGCPCQSRACVGGGPSIPSHQTVLSGSSATLVKIVLARQASIALGLVARLVPGATPKKPASGLTRVQPAVGSELEPGDVVADRFDLPARLAIGLGAARAWPGWSCRTPTERRRR